MTGAGPPWEVLLPWMVRLLGEDALESAADDAAVIAAVPDAREPGWAAEAVIDSAPGAALAPLGPGRES
ncbi:hypothetical protein [Nocardia sp. R7R-8]|uniref:hypothetical protein n=1 Tax=Nocardia sp. R7R-8 TaxID=3459304 RepID=UPI00403D6380